MFVRIANREYPDPAAFSEHLKKQYDSGLHCFSMPFHARIQKVLPEGVQL